MTNNSARSRRQGLPAKAGANDGPATFDRLLAALQEGDDLVASAAASELGQYRSSEAIAALIDALGRSGPVGQEAAQSLAKIGEPAIEKLIAALQSRNEIERWHAAKALAGIAAPSSVPALVAALWDEDDGVRWEATYGLGAVGLPALAPLLRALATEELTVHVAECARWSLQRLAPLVPNLRLEHLIGLLDHHEAHISVPVEAYRLLRQLDAPAEEPSAGQ